MSKSLNNITETLRDDLAAQITPGCCVSVAADQFSMYAYQALKTELDKVKEFRFIYTSPTFTKEKPEKRQMREWYIPRLGRERSLYGTDFELRLRHELKQKAVAQACADWIKKKARFLANVSGVSMNGFALVETENHHVAYLPLQGFSTADLGCGSNNSLSPLVIRLDEQESQPLMKNFHQLWEDQERFQDVTKNVLEKYADAYRENSPELIYFLTLHHVLSPSLESMTEDTMPNEATGYRNSVVWNKLYDFQRDAVLGIINKLERFNGCILADSVGLGKTFTALAVIKYYECRNKDVLVLCPKKLEHNWNTYNSNYKDNPLKADRLRYHVLFHTDLSRRTDHVNRKVESNGVDLRRIEWGNYDLVVIDESHNFRTGASSREGVENRYTKLMEKVMRAGVKTRVLMLSATPVNNRFTDLKNQLALAYEGDTSKLDVARGEDSNVEAIFRKTEKAFNLWNKMDSDDRSVANLQQLLPFDFFRLLDDVTIARSRKHITQYYDSAAVGKFPERLKPLSLSPGLTDAGSLSYQSIACNYLEKLNLAVYLPSSFILPSRRDKYLSDEGANLTTEGSELGIRRLMGIGLLKRLESSVEAFRLTVSRVLERISATITTIDSFLNTGQNAIVEGVNASTQEEAEQTAEEDEGALFSVGNRISIDLRDMDVTSWRRCLQDDATKLTHLLQRLELITPEKDAKLLELLRLIGDKQSNPINPGNKKLLIFTAFADTAKYLYQNISPIVKKRYGLECAMVTGGNQAACTLQNLSGGMNSILTFFSPRSRDRALLYPEDERSVDILIATDCVSEGQNLQDCDIEINYDIHWNPVRLIQRFGRVDRIGSVNSFIQMVNFWPDVELDEYIKLKSRVESRMKAGVLTSTGDDNLLDSSEQDELEFRSRQLKRLQAEVVDMEDMSAGVSIMDLGLNEFRQDLLEWLKKCPDPESLPDGLHAVVPATTDLPPGALFVLRRTGTTEKDPRNLLDPWYLVYVDKAGECVCSYTEPRRLLETMRRLCRGHSVPFHELCRSFNRTTKDGKDMALYSHLLNAAISSIIGTAQESMVDSLFTEGGTTDALSVNRDEFALLCFIAVEDAGKGGL